MISQEETKRIAKLARLKLTEKEEEELQKDLSEALDYFETLKELDTENVEPVFNPTEEFLKKDLREDRAEPEETAEEIISQFSEKEGRRLKVKTILK